MKGIRKPKDDFKNYQHWVLDNGCEVSVLFSVYHGEFITWIGFPDGRQWQASDPEAKYSEKNVVLPEWAKSWVGEDGSVRPCFDRQTSDGDIVKALTPEEYRQTTFNS